MRNDCGSKQGALTPFPAQPSLVSNDDSGRFTHACLLLLLLLRPGAGVLSDGHRISFRYLRSKTQTHPQTLPVGLLFFPAATFQQTMKG
jgi:hypothetical protein